MFAAAKYQTAWRVSQGRAHQAWSAAGTQGGRLAATPIHPRVGLPSQSIQGTFALSNLHLLCHCCMFCIVFHVSAVWWASALQPLATSSRCVIPCGQPTITIVTKQRYGLLSLASKWHLAGGCSQWKNNKLQQDYSNAARGLDWPLPRCLQAHPCSNSV